MNCGTENERGNILPGLRGQSQARRMLSDGTFSNLYVEAGYARALSMLASGKLRIEFGSHNDTWSASYKAIMKCTSGAMGEDGEDYCEAYAYILYDDFFTEGSVYDLLYPASASENSWNILLNSILFGSPGYVGSCLSDYNFSKLDSMLSLTQLRIAGHMARAVCAWIIERKKIPPIRTSHQAVSYLISHDNCHNRMARNWFEANPRHLKPRSWWLSKQSNLSWFLAAQALDGNDDLRSAFSS